MLRGREARMMGEAARVAEGWTPGQGTSGGRDAQALQELQTAWADLRRTLERVERAEQEGKRPSEQAQESGGSEDRPPLKPFRQPLIPPEVEREMQERAWRKIRGEAARLAERDRELAVQECRVREEEGAVARGAHRVIPDPEGYTPPTDVEGRSPSGKRATGEGGEAGQARGERRLVEERGAGEAAGAPQPTSPSPEPKPTDWGSELPLPWRYARQPARRAPGTVPGWRAGGVAELVRYVKWEARKRGGQERPGTHPFCDLVSRAGRLLEKEPEVEEGRRRRMLGAALPGVNLDCPKKRGKKPRVQMLRELLQREGWY